MIEFKADMHCHSTCSDGSLTPKEIILLAEKKGLKGLSITDHDTIKAYLDSELFALAASKGIILCPGVEFSSATKGKNVHILGYAFPVPNPELEEFCKKHQERRKSRNRAILDKLRKHRMPIDEEELEIFNIPVVGRPHIAQLMVEKGYVKNILQAFQKYIGDGKPCFDPGPVFTVEDTIDTIHKGKGKAFLAHPHLIVHKNLLKHLLSLPFDGIECYYAKYPLQEKQKWAQMAKERNLLVSGGSDFHGEFKPGIELGSSWTNEDDFKRIQRDA